MQLCWSDFKRINILLLCYLVVLTGLIVINDDPCHSPGLLSMSALHLSWARLDKVSQAGQSQDICHDGENNFYLAHLAPNCQETSVSLSRFPCPPSLRVGSLEDRGGSWHESGHSGYLELHLTPQTITMCSVQYSVVTLCTVHCAVKGVTCWWLSQRVTAIRDGRAIKLI